MYNHGYNEFILSIFPKHHNWDVIFEDTQEKSVNTVASLNII